MKAMILAAGRGERMRPLTDATPKPLLAAGGKPLIVWQIEGLARAGFRDLVINHAHLGAHDRSRARRRRRAGASASRYSREGRSAGNRRRHRQALPLLGDAPFAAVNGDVYCDYPISPRCLRTALPDDAGAHLVLVDNPPQHPERRLRAGRRPARATPRRRA